MDRIADISQKVYDQINAQQAESSKKCQELITLKFDNTKKYEELVDIWYAPVEGSKFQALKGEAVVNADIMTVLADIHDITECTPDMPAADKDGKVCRYIYFPSEDVKSKVMSIKDKTGIKDGNSYLCYQLIESPSAMISRREFYILKTTSGDDQKVIITQNTVDGELPSANKAVRGQMQSCIVLQAEGGKTKVSTYFHVDPCGSIPAMIFTGSLNKQNNFLVKLVKKYQ